MSLIIYLRSREKAFNPTMPIKDKDGLPTADTLEVLADFGELVVTSVDRWIKGVRYNCVAYAITHRRSSCIVRTTEVLVTAKLAAEAWSKFPIWDFDKQPTREECKPIQAILQETVLWDLTE